MLRMPTLATMLAPTLSANVTRLSQLLAIERRVVIQCVRRMPQLLYLKPEGVAAKLQSLARCLCAA